MKKQNALNFWLFAILSCSLINCSRTPAPPDVPACTHLTQRLYQDPVTKHVMLAPSPVCMKEVGEAECGHCVYIISGKEVFIGEEKGHWLNGKPWSKIRQQSVYLPALESYAPLSTYIINSCAKLKCDDEVNRFRIKLKPLDETLSPFLTE